MLSRRLLLSAALLLALCASSCRPDLVLRMATRVFHDGSLSRQLELQGRTDEGEEPEEADWLRSKVGIRLADPDAWDRLDERPGGLAAEGFFRRVEDLPRMLAYRTEVGELTDRVRTDLEIDDKVVIKRWVYRELHGDPYSASESSAALDALIEMLVDAMEQELTREFGDDFDTAPAAEFLRGEGRALASAILSVKRRRPGLERLDTRSGLWADVLSQHGVPVADYEDGTSFWEEQWTGLFDWVGSRLAASLSTPDNPIRPADLSFWPVNGDHEEKAAEIVERVWGGEDALLEQATPHLTALSGYFAVNSSPRLRFEMSLRMPGVLLTTNGSPGVDSVAWLFRAEDLAFGERILQAESVELQREPLTRLGARRDLDHAELLQLADLLWKRDPDGILADLLARAVDRADIGLLHDPESVPDPYQPLWNDLATLLTPE